MFGYFRPYRANLTKLEEQLFNAYYCRVCYCLRSIGGQRARFLTTFDAAVYSLILNIQKGESDPPALPCQRIGKSNMKLFSSDETGMKFAYLTLVSFAEKFRDDLIDGSGKSKFAAALYSKPVKKAQKAEPELAKIAFEGTNEINALQDSNAPLFDVLAAYGNMAIKSFSEFMPLSKETAELIRRVSEWIFFIDMLCDYDEDYADGSYNGLKKEECKTFSEYFDNYYVEFTEIERTVTDRLVAALYAVKDGSRRWNALFKIIMYSVDNVIPSIIGGEDVKFHYFKELRHNHRELIRRKRDKKRLGVRP